MYIPLTGFKKGFAENDRAVFQPLFSIVDYFITRNVKWTLIHPVIIRTLALTHKIYMILEYQGRESSSFCLVMDVLVKFNDGVLKLFIHQRVAESR